MKKINMIVGCILLLLVDQSALALPTKPNKCPSISAIKARGLDTVSFSRTSNSWIVGVIAEQYDTNVQFTFAVGGIPARNATIAKKVAILSLETLAFVKGPTEDSLTNHWVCNYNAYHGRNYPTQAWTPANNIS